MQYIIEVNKSGFPDPLWIQDWEFICKTCRSVCKEKWAAHRFPTREAAQEIVDKIPEALDPIIYEVNFVGDWEV